MSSERVLESAIYKNYKEFSKFLNHSCTTFVKSWVKDLQFNLEQGRDLQKKNFEKFRGHNFHLMLIKFDAKLFLYNNFSDKDWYQRLPPSANAEILSKWRFQEHLSNRI